MIKRFQAIFGTVLLGCTPLGGPRPVFCQQPNEARGKRHGG